jgi:hypothetical protein
MKMDVTTIGHGVINEIPREPEHLLALIQSTSKERVSIHLRNHLNRRPDRHKRACALRNHIPC